HLAQAFEIVEDATSFGLVYNLAVTATVYRDLGDYEKAKKTYKRAIEIAKQNRMYLHRISPMNALASLCWALGEAEEAIRFSKEVVVMTRDLGMRRDLAKALGWLSQRLLELNRSDEALPCLKEAAELCAQIGDRDEEARALTGLAYVRENSR